jgi:flagellar motility protein MotE (MotC chaperone)
MKKMLVLGVLALVLFGASATLSWYLKKSRDAAQVAGLGELGGSGDAPAKKETNGLHIAPAKQGTRESIASETRPAVRPPYDGQAESAAQLYLNLARQQEALRSREEQLATRQKNVDLIFSDIRSERGTLDELRKQVMTEVRLLDEKLAEFEQKAGDLAAKAQETDKASRALEDSRVKYGEQEEEKVKQLAGLFDAMAPENAARSLLSMADSGSLDTAAKILSQMKERQAAKVLNEFQDQAVANQIFQKITMLKKPTPPATKK